MKNSFLLFAFFCSALAAPACFGQSPKVLVNHLGYEFDAPKRAVILGHATDAVTGFSVIDCATGKPVLTGDTTKAGPVDQWKDWCFWSADFGSISNAGSYLVECATSQGAVRSFPFKIERGVLERNTLSTVIYYFKEARCSGLLDKADRHVKFEDATNTADVHGGWYDATGDYGIHLGELGFLHLF